MPYICTAEEGGETGMPSLGRACRVDSLLGVVVFHLSDHDTTCMSETSW